MTRASLVIIVVGLSAAIAAIAVMAATHRSHDAADAARARVAARELLLGDPGWALIDVTNIEGSVWRATAVKHRVAACGLIDLARFNKLADGTYTGVSAC